METAIRRNKNFINGKKIFVRRTETEPFDEEVYGANPKRPWELKVRNVFTDFSDEDSNQGPLVDKSGTLPSDLQWS